MNLEYIFLTDYVSETPFHKSHSELKSFLNKIEKQNKRLVNLEVIGKSPEGREIYCLELGNRYSENKILLVSNAHGEEVNGCEEILHIIKLLTENPDFKKTFLENYQFVVVPTVNPDAREYNLRWAKNMDLSKFFLDYKRTITDKNNLKIDLEWSYPFRDDTNIKRPELAAMIELMDSQKFDMFIDIHGAIGTYKSGFWYMIDETKGKKDKLVNFLYNLGKSSGLPLNAFDMGPLCPRLKPGVYGLLTAKRILKELPHAEDYLEQKGGVSSMDYFMRKNPEGQIICCELPTFYHEKYLDNTVSDKKELDIKKTLINHYIHLWKEKIIPLTEKALQIEPHPKLKAFREGIDKKEIVFLRDRLLELKEEEPYKKAEVGEVNCSEMSKYWLAPGYGQGGYVSDLFGEGLAGVISELPLESRIKLAEIYKICSTESKKAAKNALAFGLKKFALAESINIQGKACLGSILAYFTD